MNTLNLEAKMMVCCLTLSRLEAIRSHGGTGHQRLGDVYVKPSMGYTVPYYWLASTPRHS